MILTVSKSDDVTRALVNPVCLMLARTGAPKPIEESCRLRQSRDKPFQTPSTEEARFGNQ